MSGKTPDKLENTQSTTSLDEVVALAREVLNEKGLSDEQIDVELARTHRSELSTPPPASD